MLRTLIIDDDEIVRFLQQKMVTKCELDPDPYVFKEAQKALDFLENDSDKEIDYLIMLDINMPGMTGWDFLNKLKLVSDNERFHVVMVTSSIDRKDKRDAAEDPHVVDFIEKPVSARHCSKLKGIAKLSAYFEES
ncbi:response regulator [Christiangramia forsetii]|uniref:Protein containing response regulator receiver domain n=2 Tax=Christiangramia forsetii TaxID=411153 RepID=A0M2U9_CHRFK|nr:response regulator [Christiangramia forsetii]GGG44652.1 response regulator [Christiangramia forsetii]CAL66944.1 protein containing response regulator receiver domain [Christiangramia forsetii KT0803]